MDVYLKKVDVLQPEYPLSINELKDAFFSLQTRKSPSHDEISFDVIKSCFGSLSKLVLHIFRLSLEERIFPDDLKTAKVTPIFKTSNENDFGNYRPISVLSCFSKILEKIMDKRLFNHLSKHNLLYQKQYGFPQGHSTEHAIMQVIDQINDNLENNCFTLGIFIDPSKAFDNVDHQILISKSNNYGVKGKNLSWFKSYLENRKQCLNYSNDVTNLAQIKCGVRQGSISGPSFFLIYVNDLCNASNILDLIMSADDTNLFLSHQILILFLEYLMKN